MKTRQITSSKKLHVGARLQPLLPQQRLHPRHDVVFVADVAQDGGGGRGVKGGEVRAPPAAALAAIRVVRAGNRPPPDVLATGAQPDRLRRIGPEPIEAGRHPPGVDQLFRLLGPVHELAVRVFRIRTSNRPTARRNRSVEIMARLRSGGPPPRRTRTPPSQDAGRSSAPPPPPSTLPCRGSEIPSFYHVNQ